jgi:membrane protein DedA with SNARE-associated domain
MIEALAHLSPLTAYISVFGMMILNGVINVPSSQLLYIFVGYLTTISEYSLYHFVLFGALGNTFGNIILYELVRANKHGAIKGFDMEEIASPHFKKMIESHGAWYIFFGKLIPGLKVFMPVVAGFFNIRRKKVYGALTAASLLWAYALVQVGAVFGKDTDITRIYMIIVGGIIIGTYVYAYKYYPDLFKRPLQKTAKNTTKI